MPWVALTADVHSADCEAAQALLFAQGAAGLEVREPHDRLMPGVRAPAPEEAIVIAYFAAPAEGHRAAQALRKAFPHSRTSLDEVEERDWSTEWRARIRSVCVGRVWVGPPWERAQVPADKTCLFIEPKMAFGTGDHPTTSLCLRAVDEYLAEHHGASVLDVGTGTGVLALAARRLGASRTVGVDNDRVAVELARECAVENDLPEVEFSSATLDQVDGRFDLVLANILSNTLVELAPLLCQRLKGRLVLSGILLPQADEVRSAFLAQGLRAAGSAIEGEWVRLDFEWPP